MPVRLIITTLKPGVDPRDYEKWVREYDYKVARARENMISYQVFRIVGAPSVNDGSQLPWSYVERIEIRSLEKAAEDAKSASGVELRRQMGEFVDRSKNITVLLDPVE